MNDLTPEKWLILLVIALFLVARRRNLWLDQWRDSDLYRRFFRVYSAETTTGREAEFIRDRLPHRTPWWIIAALVMLAGIVWWLGD